MLQAAMLAHELARRRRLVSITGKLFSTLASLADATW
jgi:hypothetical protein